MVSDPRRRSETPITPICRRCDIQLKSPNQQLNVDIITLALDATRRLQLTYSADITCNGKALATVLLWGIHAVNLERDM